MSETVDQYIPAPRILKQTTIRTKRGLYTYLTATFFVFAFTLLATSIAQFLIEKLPDASNPIFYVGLLLGLASFFALFIDTVWSNFQERFSARSLMFGALIGLIATVMIFLLTQQLFVFAVLAAFLYGWSYDLYDVTMLTTILRQSDPKQAAQNISQKRVAEVLGILSGLLLSGPLLYFGSEVAQMLLIVILALVLIFAKNHFDRPEDAQVALRFADDAQVDWKEIFFHIADPGRLGGLLNNVGQDVRERVLSLSQDTADVLKNSATNAQEVLQKAKLQLVDILEAGHHVVPQQHQRPKPQNKISLRETWADVVSTFKQFFGLFHAPQGTQLFLMWAAVVIIFFSFWDTMAVTFQPLLIQDFFNEGWLKVLSGFILALFVLPILVLQIPIAKMADRFGHKLFVTIGLLISGGSLFFLATAVYTESIWLLIVAGMGNSVGYACAFVPAQAFFTLMLEQNQPGITKAKSAGLLRIGLNTGNILGQILGGTILAFFGFTVAFYLFSVLLVGYGLYSLIFFILTPSTPAPKL